LLDIHYLMNLNFKIYKKLQIQLNDTLIIRNYNERIP